MRLAAALAGLLLILGAAAMALATAGLELARRWLVLAPALWLAGRLSPAMGWGTGRMRAAAAALWRLARALVAAAMAPGPHRGRR